MSVRLLLVGGLLVGGYLLLTKIAANAQPQFAPPIVPERPQADGWATNVVNVLDKAPAVINSVGNAYTQIFGRK
jgi:hypothetical protein